jgi:predicted nucleic acid-binding protein
MIVSDSTPLIYLAKLGHLALLRKLFLEVNVPDEVMTEVMRGKQLGFDDAAIIEKAVQEGWIKAVKPNSLQRRELLRLRQTFSDISDADAAAIVLAKSLGVNLCLDDSRAIKVAEALDIKHIGTLGILLLAVKKEVLSREQVKELVLSLPERGFYVAHDLLAEFLKKLERFG